MMSQNSEAFQYPCIISNSSSIFPNYLVLPKNGSIITIGREADNDICISSSHISRLHAEIMFNGRGNLEIKDVSRNGILHDGQKLPQDKAVELSTKKNIRLDFHDDFVLEILFYNPEDHSRDGNKGAHKVDSSNSSLDHNAQGAVPSKGNFTEIFFLNELEDIDNIHDSPDKAGGLNLQPKSDEYTRGQYSQAGNISSNYRNREQNSFSVFSDLGKNSSSVNHGSTKTSFNIPLPIIVATVILSLITIIIAVLIF